MSQSDLDYDDFPDEILAAIPNDALSGMQVPRFATSGHSGVSREPTLARSQDLILAPASGLSLFGERRRAAFFSTPEPPDFNADDTLQLTPTHVSPSGFAVMDRSQSPSTERDGPMTWNSNQVRLSQQVTDVRDHLINALRSRDQRQALESMKDFDDNSIRDGVDLVIAGMLEHKAVTQSLAQALQDLMLLLISDRGIKFTTNHRFAGLLDDPAGKSPRKLKNKEKESPEQTVYRVWGKDYHKLLGLSSTHKLFDPLSRLAHYSEILNQHPDQLSKYLDKYASIRLGEKRPGRRDRITGKDIKALNRDLRTIVINAHHRYTSLIAPKVLPEEGRVPEANLQRFASESDEEGSQSGSDANDRLSDPDVTPIFEHSNGAELPTALQQGDNSAVARDAAKDPDPSANELVTYYSTFAISADHRNEYTSIPPSHVKFQVPRGVPLKVLVDLETFRTSATIHGYTGNGSFRYDVGQKYRLAHVRIVAYYNPEHATHSTKYNGSWIVLPPFRQSAIQLGIWTNLSRIASRATGLHGFHRLATCSSTDEVQGPLARGYNITIRNQDQRKGYPWASINLLQKLEDLGLDPDEMLSWQVYDDPQAPELRATVPGMFAKFSAETVKFDVPRRAAFTPSRTGLRSGMASTFGEASSMIHNRVREFVYNPWRDLDVEADVVEHWKDTICDQFPLRNGDRLSRDETATRYDKLGVVPIRGSELRWFLAKGEWNVRRVTGLLADMASNFALEGSINTAGLLEPLDAAPHGACTWLKLHYGHALLFLAYDQYTLDDTVIPTEYFAGDVMSVSSPPGELSGTDTKL